MENLYIQEKEMDITKVLRQFEADNKLKGLAPETIKYYDTMLNIFIRKTRIRQTEQLSQEFIDDYKLYLIDTQKSTASVNAHLRALRRFIHFLQLKITVSQIHSNPIPKPTYTDTDIKDIIAAAKPEDEDSVIALLLIASGIRSATLRSIRVIDISFTEHNITLRHTKNKRPYILPLPDHVMNILRQYIIYYQRKDEDLLFPSKKGTQMSHEMLWRHMAKYLCKIGVNQTGVHKFRHTFAKTICKNGLNNAIMLMRLLGQSTIQQAEHYVNLYGNELRDCMLKYNPTES